MSRNLQLLVAIVILLSVVGGVQVWSYYHEPEEVQYFGEAVADPRSYKGKIRKMTEINPELEENELKFSLHKVDRHDIVFFEIERKDEVSVPVMAYITPTGRLFVGVSFCEPCGGTSFSLAGEALLSEKCRTLFHIEDHSFVSGSRRCREYPPQPLDYKLEQEMIAIPLEDVKEWEPRYSDQANANEEEE